MVLGRLQRISQLRELILPQKGVPLECLGAADHRTGKGDEQGEIWEDWCLGAFSTQAV